jgi:GTP-binding protein
MSRYSRARFLRSAASADDFGDDSGAEVAFVGRSNSGKSSALNAILQRKDLARTSRTPGRTQMVNLFELEPGQRIADLPGYGYARVPDDVRAGWERLMDSYFSDRESLAGVILIVDSRRGIGPGDEAMVAYASKRGVPIHVLLAKSDKLGRGALRPALESAGNALRGKATVQLFSARSGDGVAAAQGALEALLDHRRA